jgi:hypothetical protein
LTAGGAHLLCLLQSAARLGLQKATRCPAWSESVAARNSLR